MLVGKNMRIALLTNGVFPFVIGGIQKHSYALAKNFAKHDVNVDVYHFKSVENDQVNLNLYFTELELSKINFIEIRFPKLNFFKGHYIYSSYFYSKALYENLFGKDYDVIYAQGFTSWYFLKQPTHNLRLITNLHGLEMFQDPINFNNRLEQLLLKIPAKKIILNSKTNISLGGKLTSILYDNGAPKNSVIEHPRVNFKGLIADMEVLKKEFLKADILVCPSYAEGMPTVILEAMASGCAIIATDVGAINTMVDHQNGWLIEGDIKKGLDEAIHDALHLDREELLHKKMVSIDRVANKFTWDHVIKQTINTIRHIKI